MNLRYNILKYSYTNNYISFFIISCSFFIGVANYPSLLSVFCNTNDSTLVEAIIEAFDLTDCIALF